MPPVSPELRTIAETAFRALNSGDLDGYLSVIAWWRFFRTEDEAREALSAG